MLFRSDGPRQVVLRSRAGCAVLVAVGAREGDRRGVGQVDRLGLTAEGSKPEEFFNHDEAMQLGLDFISYHWAHLPNSFVTAQADAGIPIITWTVRDAKAVEHTYKYAKQMTFEGFDPRENPAA